MLPTTKAESFKCRSAAAADDGWRSAEQSVEPRAHLRGAGPLPIAPSTLTRRTLASATSGEMGARSSPGSGRARILPLPSYRLWAQLVSRLVPSETSPPAQKRISRLEADCARVMEPLSRKPASTEANQSTRRRAVLSDASRRPARRSRLALLGHMPKVCPVKKLNLCDGRPVRVYGRSLPAI